MNDNSTRDPQAGPPPNPPPNTPPEGAGGTAGSDPDLAALLQERDALQNQLKRSLADLANVRQRHQKEMGQARAMATESFARELLPVLDNFHLALEAHEQHEAGASKSEAHALVEGVRMVRSLLEAVLERHGVREIEGHGQPFDPNRHEAVGLDAGSDVAPGHVARVLQRGYFLGDKVLRPSRVLVRDQRTGTNDATPAAEG